MITQFDNIPFEKIFWTCYLYLSYISLGELQNRLESKVLGFQYELARSVSNHEKFYQEGTDKGDAMKQPVSSRKDSKIRAWCKYRHCITMKTEKICLCCNKVETVRDFNFQTTFVLNQAVFFFSVQHLEFYFM